MKRSLTLTSGILGVVGNSLGILSTLLFIIAVLSSPEIIESSMTADELLVYQQMMPIIIFVLVLVCALSIIGLVFNIVTIDTSKKPCEQFKKGVVVTAIVFDFLCLTPLMLAAAILGIVDVCNEKKRKGFNGDATCFCANQEVSKNVVVSLEDKIEKLNNMKVQGLINENEYKALKKAYIQDKINGKK